MFLVEDCLSNDEDSTDEELLDYFVSNGLCDAQARQALSYREQYLLNIYLNDFTPIRNPGEILRFDPHSCQFEPD
nr:hypothetical protein [Luteimonas sp. XNQY3]